METIEEKEIKKLRNKFVTGNIFKWQGYSEKERRKLFDDKTLKRLLEIKKRNNK